MLNMNITLNVSMAGRLLRGIVLSALIMFILGIFLIYSGAFEIYPSSFLTNQGEYDDVFRPLDMFWRVLGVVYVFLGAMCFPAGIGLLLMKTWARKNSAILMFAVLILASTIGMVIALYDYFNSIPYFSVTLITLAIAMYLRKPRIKDTYEFHGQNREIDYLQNPDYRAIKERKVTVRAPKYASSRSTSVKCTRCNTVNNGDQTNCKMCGKELA